MNQKLKWIALAFATLLVGCSIAPKSAANDHTLLIVWTLTDRDPLTFVPKGASPDSPGRWLEDEARSVRFFIPDGGVEGISARILEADAKPYVESRHVPASEMMRDALRAWAGANA